MKISISLYDTAICSNSFLLPGTPLVELRVCDRKVAESRFDSRTGNASLCPRERHCTLISHWGQAVYPLWWPSLTKDLQAEPKKCSALVNLDLWND